MSHTVCFKIEGRVQGVGFRYWTIDQAQDLGLNGNVKNLADGTVEVLAHGPGEDVDKLIAVCMSGPFSARVDGLSIMGQWSGDPQGLAGKGFFTAR